MKAYKIVLELVVVLAFALVFASAFGEETVVKVETAKVVPAPDPALAGVVAAKMDPKGAVSDVTLTTADGQQFKVVVNDNGAKMGKELNGKSAEVTAELAILTFKKVVPEKPKTPSAADTGKEVEVEVIEKTEKAEADAAKALKEKAKEVVKEGAEVKSVTWVGTVKNTKDPKVAPITFTTDDGEVWKVVANDVGTKMGKELDGQKAEITFELSILTFKEVDVTKLNKDIEKIGEKVEKEVKTEIKVIEKEPK